MGETLILPGVAGSYKNATSLDQRRAESARVAARYPDRVPVIIEKALNSDAPVMERTKYLVPRDFGMGQFIYILRSRMNLSAEKALFFFVGRNVLPPTSSSVSQVYDDHRDEDGFMYMVYSCEHAFGCSNT